MLCPTSNEDHFDRLEQELRNERALTSELMSKVVTEACGRLAALSHTDQAARMNRLMKSEAWTDATLALIALELPVWRLRRLVFEDGEWLCSLSKQTNLPADLDDTADANHEVLPLAILSAFLEVKRRVALLSEANSHSVPQVRSAQTDRVCCDNFA